MQGREVGNGRGASPEVPSDLELLGRVRVGDAHAANLLLERHVAAVRGLGRPDVAWSGREVLHRVKNHESLVLPFRAAWLAQEIRGTSRLPAPPGDAVWGAYVMLPAAGRLAVWHREVEGESAREIALYLGLGARETTDVLVASYAALRRALAVSHYGVGRAAAQERDLAVVDHTLGTALAATVLGEAGAGYLATRPRRPRLRAVEPQDGLLHGRARVGVAVLAAASVAVVATSSVLLGGSGGTPDREEEVPLAETALVPPVLVLRAEPTRERTRRADRERPRPDRSSATGPDRAGAPAAPASSGSPTVDEQPATPTPDPAPDPAPDPEQPEPPAAPSRPAEEPAPEPLVSVDLGAGQVSVDPGLPTGPVEIELPISLPVPPIVVPGLS